MKNLTESQKAKKRYHERKAAGVCVKCQMPVVAGRTLCAKHLAKYCAENARYKAKRVTQKAERAAERAAKNSFYGGFLHKRATAEKEHTYTDSVDLSQYKPGDVVRIDWGKRNKIGHGESSHIYPSLGAVIHVTNRVIVIRSMLGYRFTVSVADLLTGVKITADDTSSSTESPESLVQGEVRCNV